MSDILSRLANTLPIRWGYFKKNGQPQKVIFVGHEKAIYGADGMQLDNKLTSIKDSLSDAFLEDRSYTVGQYCIYLNRLYKFAEAKAEGPWDGSKVVPVSVTQELGALNGDNGKFEEFTTDRGMYRKWDNGYLEQVYDSRITISIPSKYNNLYQTTHGLLWPIEFKSISTAVCCKAHWGTGASWGTIMDYNM